MRLSRASSKFELPLGDVRRLRDGGVDGDGVGPADSLGDLVPGLKATALERQGMEHFPPGLDVEACRPLGVNLCP